MQREIGRLKYIIDISKVVSDNRIQENTQLHRSQVTLAIWPKTTETTERIETITIRFSSFLSSAVKYWRVF